MGNNPALFILLNQTWTSEKKTTFDKAHSLPLVQPNTPPFPDLKQDRLLTTVILDYFLQILVHKTKSFHKYPRLYLALKYLGY